MADEFYTPPSTYYNAPGAAAGNAIQQFMVNRRQQQQQALMDSIALRHQAQQEQFQQQEMDIRAKEEADRAAQQKAQREDLIQRSIERKTQDVEKRIQNMVPGDVPDPEMLSHADELGLGGNFPKPAPAQQTMPGVVAPTAAPAAIRLAPTPNEPPAQVGLTGATDATVRPYVGNRQDREKSTHDAEVKHLSDQLALTDPGSPEFGRLAMQYEMLAGKSIPAGMVKPPAPPKEGRRLIFDPIAKHYTDPQGNIVTNLDRNDVVDRSAEARPVKDTSVSDAAKVQSAREHGYAEHKDAYKKVNDQMDALDNLDEALKSNSAAADGLIVPMLMKGTIAGGGVRITQPEIDAVLKSRGVFDSMQLTMNKWFSQAPDAQGNRPPLVLTADQKAAIADLSAKLRARAMARHQQLNEARKSIDAADTVDAVNKARTSYEEDRYTAPPPAKLSAAELIKKYSKAAP